MFYFTTEHTKNVLAMISSFVLLTSIDSDVIAPLLLGLATVSFYQGFVETLVAEIYVTQFEKNEVYAKYAFLTISFLLSGFAVLILFLVSILDIAPPYLVQFRNEIALTIFFSSSILVFRSFYVLNGQMTPLSIANLVETIFQGGIVFACILKSSFSVIILLRFARLPVINISYWLFGIIELCASKIKHDVLFDSNRIFGFLRYCKTINIKHNYILAVNLFLKSFTSNQDIVLVNLTFGNAVTTTYKFLLLIKQIVLSITGTLWKMWINQIIGHDSIIERKTQKYVVRLMALSVLGSLLVLPAFPILNYLTTTSLLDFIGIKLDQLDFQRYRTESFVFILLLLLPQSSTQWTRIILLLKKRIDISTCSYILISVALLLSTQVSSSFFSFLISYGLCVMIILVVQIIRTGKLILTNN